VISLVKINNVGFEKLGNLSLAIYFIKDAALKYNIKLELMGAENGFNGEVKYNGIVPIDMFVEPFWTEAIIRLLGHSDGNSAVDIIKMLSRESYKTFEIIDDE
jgi:hypothetical protein